MGSSDVQSDVEKRSVKDAEKGSSQSAHEREDAVPAADFVTDAEQRDLKRGLEQRHISMLALAGAIGTGLFLSLGGAIEGAGPLGALLAYLTIGLIVCAVQFALGEVSALYPVQGSFVRHAETLIDPAAGFAVGWNMVYGNLLSVPAEITAICVLFEFWTDLNPSVFIISFIVLTVIVGFSMVRVFGEVEFGFAVLKIALVVFLVIFGLVVNLGGVPGVERIGFRYWKDPGVFVEYIATGGWGRFLGYWYVMTSAVYSFAGVESLAMAAAETRNPSRAIPRACKRVFARIILFYLLTVLVVGMLVASNDPRLSDDSGTAAQSPFVIAAQAAGYGAVGSVVNAIVITSAWSSSNQALLSGTRVLYGLALKGHAPKIFARTTSWGVPYYGVALFAAVSFLSFMTLSSGALTVFYWLLDLVAVGTVISWIAILTNHIRLKLAMRKQGIAWSRLPWNNRGSYYSSWFAVSFLVLILITNGFSVFTKGNWDPSTFVASYIDIPLVLAVYVFWKVFKRTRRVDLKEVNIAEAITLAQEETAKFDAQDAAELAAKGGRRGVLRFISWLWD